MPNRAVVFYARLPSSDLVGKTRLGKEIGNQDLASELARNLIFDTWAEYSSGDWDFIFYYRGDLEHFAARDLYPVTKYVEQLAGELSIKHIHSLMLEQYDQVIVVGSDIPLISATTIENCFTQLKSQDLVIVPVEDGGYGLVGMKQFHDIYSDISNWDSRSAGYALCKQTLDIAKNLGLTVHLEPKTFDIDHLADLQKLQKSDADKQYLQRTLKTPIG